MTSKTINFTKLTVQNLTAEKGAKRTSFKDSQINGLVIDVRVTGSKSFYLYKKIRGVPEKIFLGKFPDLSIENARKLALIKLGEIAVGKNPLDEIRKERNESTFEEMFQEYMNRYSKKHKKSWKYDEREVTKFLSHWFKRKIGDINRTDVQRLVEKVHDENGLYQANRLLERIRGIYNKKIEWGWEGTNPAKGIKKYREKSRDRFILPAELPLILQAIREDENPTARDFFLISLMTGARKSNVLAMRWDQIDWHQKQWRIPETKNGDPVLVPLIHQAIEILEARRSVKKNEYVFEGEGAKGFFSDPKHAWERIRQKATLDLWRFDENLKVFVDRVEKELKEQDNYGFTVVKLVKTIMKQAQIEGIYLPPGLLDLRIHDIRRTLGSYQAITGASLPIIGKTLGHKNSQSTAIYARLNLDPVRDAMSKAVEAMLHIQ